MRLPKRGERGFTLIELLIVVAILGVLAAVVIPNVTQFFGKGEDEARRTEFHNVSLAVASLMIDNGISSIPTPLDYAYGVPTNQMDAFVDVSATLAYKGADGTFIAAAGSPAEVLGYLLYGCQIVVDKNGDGIYDSGDDAIKQVNYVNMKQTVYFYTCESDGTVRQWADATLTTEHTQ